MTNPLLNQSYAVSPAYVLKTPTIHRLSTAGEPGVPTGTFTPVILQGELTIPPVGDFSDLELRPGNPNKTITVTRTKTADFAIISFDDTLQP